MRVKIKFTKNSELVENNQKHVNKYIHKCLIPEGWEQNKYHDTWSNYVITRMMGGKVSGRYIDYPNGGFIVVSSPSFEFIDVLINGVFSNPEFGFGMKFEDIEFITEEFHNGWNHFRTTETGIMLKKHKENGRVTYYKLDDCDFEESLKNHTLKKLKKINSNLDFSDFEVSIKKHPAHKTRRIFIKNVENWVNVCQVSIYCNKEVAEYVYNYGLGQSTGSGMGLVYKTENIHLYR